MEEYGFKKDLNRDELTVSNTQGIICEECQDLGVDAVDYVSKFMLSSVAEDFDKMKSGIYSAGPAPLKRYILQRIEPVSSYSEDKHVNEDALHWVGYIYRYWSYLLGMASKDIVKLVPVEKALRCYPAYHSMGNSEAISRMLRRLS